MKKEIKDFIHLYLGCEVQYMGLRKYLLDTHRLSAIMLSGEIDRWKLILRPLSSMTDEERKEYSAASFIDGVHNSYGVQYLLSKHFDLFSLIPEGLALDATKK